LPDTKFAYVLITQQVAARKHQFYSNGFHQICHYLFRLFDSTLNYELMFTQSVFKYWITTNGSLNKHQQKFG